MNNQRDYVFSKVERKPYLGQDCIIINMPCENPNFKEINNFMGLYSPLNLSEFELEIANALITKKVESWRVLFDNDLRIIYAGSSVFHDFGNNNIKVIDARNYLLNLSNIKRNPVWDEVTTFDAHNLTSVLRNELENHKVSLDGIEYYLVTYLDNGMFKNEVESFYGPQNEFNPIINKINVELDNEYGVLIDMNLQIQQVFNKQFAEYDFNNHNLKIKPLGEVIAGQLSPLPKPRAKLPSINNISPSPNNISPSPYDLDRRIRNLEMRNMPVRYAAVVRQ